MNQNKQIQDILLKKIDQNEIGHFYILSPGRTLGTLENHLKNWCFNLIATCMSDTQKTFNNETILNHEDFLYVNKEETTDYKLSDFSEMFSFLNYEANRFKRKFIVIDNAQKISINVANKLLKTLEEPPVTCTIFILNPSKISLLETIKSRAITLNIPLETQAQTDHDSGIEELITQIKSGQSFDEFSGQYKGAKDKEIHLFRTLPEYLSNNGASAQLIWKLDAINKQTVEDHTYNAPPLNRLHKIYSVLKEFIDG